MSDPNPLHRELLQAIVETARAIFASTAASVFLLDQSTGELVFEAVAGEGSADLVGRRFPARTGVAGSVLATGQPLVIDDVARDRRFGREAAESTGYVPTTIMAVPLLADERPLGVLEVLDPTDRSHSPLEELALLEHFAAQAAIGLQLLLEARARAQAGPAERLSERLAHLDGDRARAAGQLLDALDRLLDA